MHYEFTWNFGRRVTYAVIRGGIENVRTNSIRYGSGRRLVKLPCVLVVANWQCKWSETYVHERYVLFSSVNGLLYTFMTFAVWSVKRTEHYSNKHNCTWYVILAPDNDSHKYSLKIHQSFKYRPLWCTNHSGYELSPIKGSRITTIGEWELGEGIRSFGGGTPFSQDLITIDRIEKCTYEFRIVFSPYLPFSCKCRRLQSSQFIVLWRYILGGA